MCFSSLVLSQRTNIYKNHIKKHKHRPSAASPTPHSYRPRPGFTYMLFPSLLLQTAHPNTSDQQRKLHQ